MILDRKKKEDILEFGKTMLAQNPNLKNLPHEQILGSLDDGTQEMISNRWGVLAQVIINSITNWELKDLVDYLRQIDCPELACEYVGYALQHTYGIILEELLVVADECGYFDQITKYVKCNLNHKDQLHLQFLLPFLQTLENNNSHHAYHSILHNYSTGIALCNGFLDVVEQLNPIDSEIKYHLIYNLRRYWFAQNSDNANAQIDVFFNQPSIWAWRCALDFCEYNLTNEKFLLEKHYPQINALVTKQDELKAYLVSLFVEYIIQVYPERETHPQYSCITSHLKLLLNQLSSAKIKFLQKIEYLSDYSEEIYNIFQELLSSLEADTSVLNHLDNCFYSLYESKGYQAILNDMFVFFSTNKYGANYANFFDSIDSTLSALSRNSAKITDLAIMYINTANIDRMFFGLGLLLKLGNIKKLHSVSMTECLNYCGLYDEQQLIRVMKAILFHSIDDEMTCHFSFMLLLVIKGTSSNYIRFCMDTVFYDYPVKMYEISKTYLNSDISTQVELAVLVGNAYSSRESLQLKVRDIPDLSPSIEHHTIYHRAQMERSRQISKRANEMSIFSNWVNRKVLKYGVKNGHIIKDLKNQQLYQATPYQKFRYEHHLPVTYVTDPVKYSIRKYEFLQEVEDSASNN